MIDVTPIHLATIQRILAEHVPDCEVRAFGSRVTWTAKDYSDLDLAVVGARALDPDTLRRLKEAFEESDLPFRVDVLDWHAISNSFRTVIEKNFDVIHSGAKKSRGMAGEPWHSLSVEAIKAKIDGAIAIGPFGSRMKSDLYVASGVPVLRGNNISDTREIVGELAYVSPETAEQVHSSNVFPDDLFFPHRGAIGQVGIVPRGREQRYVLSTSLMKLTCDKHLVDPNFIFYFFRSPAGKHALLMNASTVGTPGIGQPLSSLKSIMLPVPPLHEQQAIAHILGTLDDKIELNRRMNETLEAMARALFKSWFVDFDPVRAKAEGRDPGLPKPLADLFPDSIEDSELGQIPKGWEAHPFADTIEIIGGGTPKTSVAEYWNGDIPWFSVVDAPGGADVWVVDTEKKITREGIESSSTRMLPVGTTIISARGTVGRIALVAVPMAMNQSCYGLRGKTGTLGSFTYFATRELVASLQQHAHGSVFDTITRDTLAGVSVALPPSVLIEGFETRVGPTLEGIRANLFISRTLASLRDTLMPKLISGQLRVKDADKIVEAAT